MTREAERKRLVELLDNFCKEELGTNLNKDILDKFASNLLDNDIIVLPCKVGDYIVWDSGLSKQLHQIRAFYYEPEYGLRYDLNAISPIVSHKSITRIVPREQAQKALEGSGEK